MLVIGEGLTSLKIALEYLVITILFAALYINKKHADEFTSVIAEAMRYSIILTIAAELSFTLYIDVDGVMNIVGHIFKFLSFWVLLQAIIKTSLQDPMRLMQKGSTTYNVIPYPAVVVDKEGIVRQVNIAACEETGRLESEIVGFRNHDIFHPRNIDEKNCPICESVSEGEELDDCVLRDTELNTVKQFTISSINSDESSVKGMVQVIVDMTIKTELEKQIRRQKEELTYKSNYDSLTGLPNRILLQDRVVHAIDLAKQHDTKFALLLIDIDQFKEINDTWGHQVGDAVLKKFTSILQSLINDDDTLARLGGDEFSILVEDIESKESVAKLAQSIIDATKESLDIAGHNLYISSSIGVSVFPEHTDNMNDLLRYADSAMYKAKENGRNNFQCYSSEMTENTMRKVVMQNDLRNAIENEEFVVYYQPQIGLVEDKEILVGLEALVRWEHPERGQIPPFSFIEIAEETGMIVEIDRLVMKMAINQVVEWYKEGLSPGVLSLNLAMKQLKEDDFIDTLKKIMQDTGCSSEKNLMLEITESDLMTDPESSIEKLNTLKDMGILIAIDDFGTGYSSLSYLKRLPVSKLKIDQSFTRGIPDDKDDASIVKTIIALAENLNMSIIAEGVETKEQKEFMYENGCREIQGYFYSKPMPADDTKKFIALYQ